MAPQAAFLVEEQDAAVLAGGVTAALQSPTPLVRATAARVAFVRSVQGALPALRDAIARETDDSVTRELLRAIVLNGDASDVDLAIEVASRAKWPALPEVGRAVARRDDATALYFSRLKPAGFVADRDFIQLAFWQWSVQAVPFASRVVGSGDERAWRALVGAMRQSNLLMPSGVMAAAERSWPSK